MAPKKSSMTPKKLSLTMKKLTSKSRKSSLTTNLEDNTTKVDNNLIVIMPPTQPNPIVFIDIKIGGEDVGRLLVELYMNITPKASENFSRLCTGEKGIGKQGKKLSYRKSIFFRVIPGAYAQGGDIIKNNGLGGESTYNGTPFEDENFIKSNTNVGSLAMCNIGPNSNESQFFINLDSNPDLDGKHVVFGQVKEESIYILKAINAVGSWTGKTHQTVMIRRCGWMNKPLEKDVNQRIKEEEIIKNNIGEGILQVVE